MAKRNSRRRVARPKSQSQIAAEKLTKSRPDLVPARLVLAAANTFAYGARKHGLGLSGRGTYRDAGTEQAKVETHHASLLRHLLAWRGGSAKGGEDIDPESGLPHLHHAAAQLAIVIDLVEDPS